MKSTLISLSKTSQMNVTVGGEYNPYVSTTNVNVTSTDSPSLSDRELLFSDIERFIKIYYSMFLVSVGTVFNIMSILILSRAAFRGTSTSVYLRFLACVDMFVLYNGLSRHFVSGISGYNIRYLSEGFCKFNQWSSSFGPDTSAWILVAVTTERVISIVWPHKVKLLCSKTTAATTLIAVSLVIMTSNVPLAVFYGDKEVKKAGNNKTDTNKCVALEPDYDRFLEDTWYWIDLVKFVLLPSIILILFNVIIIYVVIHSRRRVEMRGLSGTPSIRKVTTFGTFIGSGSQNTNTGRLNRCSTNTNRLHHHNNSIYHHHSRVSVSKKEMSLTITLLAINATFVVCNTPVMLYLLGASYWFPPGHGPTESLTFTASVMAMYTNNAANFLLYCATGSRFRAELRHLFAPMLKINMTHFNNSSLRKTECGSGRSLRKTECGSGRRNTATNQKLEDSLITISGSVETCYSHVSAF